MYYESEENPDGPKTNTASILSKKVIGGHVNAFDGNVSFGNPCGGFLYRHIRKGQPRLAQAQNGFYEIADLYKQPEAQPKGLVKYKNGELVK